MMQKKFNIEVDCANCAAKVETAIAQIPGVNSASISFMAQKLVIDAEESEFPRILKEAGKAGRRIDPDFAIDF